MTLVVEQVCWGARDVCAGVWQTLGIRLSHLAFPACAHSLSDAAERPTQLFLPSGLVFKCPPYMRWIYTAIYVVVCSLYGVSDTSLLTLGTRVLPKQDHQGAECCRQTCRTFFQARHNFVQVICRMCRIHCNAAKVLILSVQGLHQCSSKNTLHVAVRVYSSSSE